MSSAVVFSFESNTTKISMCSSIACDGCYGNSGPRTNLSDFGESLFALVNEKLWPINQVCTDLMYGKYDIIHAYYNALKMMSWLTCFSAVS